MPSCIQEGRQGRLPSLLLLSTNPGRQHLWDQRQKWVGRPDSPCRQTGAQGPATYAARCRWVCANSRNQAMAHIRVTDAYASAGSLCASLAE